MRIFLLLLLFWFIRLIMNIYYFMHTLDLFEKYKQYISNEFNNAIQYKSEILSIFKKADIQDSYINAIDPIGFGYMQTGRLSVFENMFIDRVDVAKIIINDFEIAIGTYRSRIMQNFNPIFWIECLIFLPKKITNYLGFNSNTLVTRIFQLIYWILSTFYAIYNEQINEFIQDFLSNFFR